MSDQSEKIKINASGMLKLVIGELYKSEHVFIRENVQNAIDAVRLAKVRELPQESESDIDVIIYVSKDKIIIEDYGIGMSKADMFDYYWCVGESSKKNKEAKEAGCIGQFGIGGFANFGICSQVSIISSVNLDGENGHFSFVKKSDLEAGEDQVTNRASSELSHRGTAIICEPLKDSPFQVEEIKKYIEKYVQYVSEKIVVDGEIYSNQVFLDSLEKFKLQDSFNLDFSHGKLTGGIYIDEDNSICISVDNVSISEKTYETNCFLKLDNSNYLEIYKHKFFISHFRNQLLSGKCDFPFVVPVASRDGFQQQTEKILEDIFLRIEEYVVHYISGRKIINYYYDIILLNRKYHHNEAVFKNIHVMLINQEEVFLSQLERIIDKDKDLYYLDDANLNVAQGLYNEGHIVVILNNFSALVKGAIKRYLVMNFNAMCVPGVMPKKISRNNLTEQQRLTINAIKQYLINQQCDDIVVQACKIEGTDLTVMFEESEKIFYVDVFSNDFEDLQNLSGDHKIYTTLVSHFVQDLAGDMTAKYRKKIFGKSGKGTDYLISFEKRKIEIKEIENIKFVKNGEKKWDGTVKGDIIEITGEFKKFNGIFFNLPMFIVDAFRERLNQEFDIEVLWYFKTAIFLIYSNIDSPPLLISMSLKITIKSSINDKMASTIKLKRHRIQLTDGGILLPIPSSIQKNFIPKKSVIEVEIGAKVAE